MTVSGPAPDLAAGSTTPTTATTTSPTTLSSLISNVGTASASGPINNLFQIVPYNLGDSISWTAVGSVGSISAGGSATASVSYTFPTTGTFCVRACADEDISGNGTVTEFNESNNCAAWTAVTVKLSPASDLQPDLAQPLLQEVIGGDRPRIAVRMGRIDAGRQRLDQEVRLEVNEERRR